MRIAASKPSAFIFPAVVAALLLMPACTVREDKQGGNKKVDIQTPVGGMHVTTKVDTQEVGLPLYPGARPKPSTRNDESSANVNISTSFFGLKVAVLEYLSDDAPEKVAEFYKKELSKYGTVLQCHSSHGPGTVMMRKGKDHELNCDEKSGDTIELKVGSENQQHVVALKPSGKGTEFALVYVSARGREEAL